MSAHDPDEATEPRSAVEVLARSVHRAIHGEPNAQLRPEEMAAAQDNEIASLRARLSAAKRRVGWALERLADLEVAPASAGDRDAVVHDLQRLRESLGAETPCETT